MPCDRFRFGSSIWVDSCPLSERGCSALSVSEAKPEVCVESREVTTMGRTGELLCEILFELVSENIEYDEHASLLEVPLADGDGNADFGLVVWLVYKVCCCILTKWLHLRMDRGGCFSMPLGRFPTNS